MSYVIRYTTACKTAVKYYNPHGFPFWGSDIRTNGWPYEDKATAQKHADQLVKQRARAGKIDVIARSEALKGGK